MCGGKNQVAIIRLMGPFSSTVKLIHTVWFCTKMRPCCVDCTPAALDFASPRAVDPPWTLCLDLLPSFSLLTKYAFMTRPLPHC